MATFELIIHRTNFVPLHLILTRMCSIFVVYTLLLSPSMLIIWLVYIPVFTLNVMYCVKRFEDFDNLLLVTLAYMTLVIYTFWYIFQKRELKRFFQQDDAK